MTDAFARLAAALADRYRIERELGEGGMAAVYLARDLKHDRDVAIKVLKPELAAVLGAERFVQEIATTAQLQHQNILPLFDSGSADGFLYYVMPYVEGESLRDRLDRETQMGVAESVALVREVADALQYAHEQGVVHRDIKPENILIHAGRPMVADFGIALAVSAAAGGRMTETGLSLGTPHYMSPEQATAEKVISARSDIYSLGSVLYEMLTGQPPHLGGSAQQIIVKIIADEARPVGQLRKSVPTNVAAAIAKALEKLPADRFESAKAFADALADPHFTVAEPGARVAAAATTRSWVRDPRTLAVSGATLLLAALALWGWLRPVPVPPVRRQVLSFGFGRPVALIPFYAGVAPDGSAIVYPDSAGKGTGALWIKERDKLDRRKLTDLPHGLGRSGWLGPSFSPDGKWIAYTDGKLEKVARAGGAPVTLSDSAAAAGAAWMDDGSIVFIGDGRHALLRTPDGGGPTTRVFTDSTEDMTRIAPVPGADGVLVGITLPQPREIAVDLRSGETHELARGATGAWVVPGDIVLYGQADGNLLASSFDRRSLTLRGSPVSVLSGVDTIYSAVAAVLGADGTVFYAEQGRGAAGAPLVSVGRDGSATAVDSTWNADIPPVTGIDLSPDGTQVALDVLDDAGNRTDVYVVHLPAGPAVRLTFDGTRNIDPAWSPDGKTILFASNRGGKMELWARRADGGGLPFRLVSGRRPIREGLWSPDGKWIVYETRRAPGNNDILAVRARGDTVPMSLVATDANEVAPALSPDGHWMAYVSRASGRDEVYVCPFPDAHDAGPWQVSTDAGREPLWSHDGTELFYRDAGGWMVEVDVSTKPTFAPGKQRRLFNARHYAASPRTHSYAVSADGRRFLMARPGGGAATAGPWVLVENWLPDLRAKLAGKG